MPRGDRTGPWGRGPRTGGGAGYCGGYDAPGFANPAPGYGRRFGGRFGGWGAGRGWGWRYRFYAPGYPAWEQQGYHAMAPEQELGGLKDEADWLRGQLEAITRLIDELERKE